MKSRTITFCSYGSAEIYSRSSDSVRYYDLNRIAKEIEATREAKKISGTSSSTRKVENVTKQR